MNLEILRAIVREAWNTGGSSVEAQAGAYRRIAECVLAAYRREAAKGDGLNLYRASHELLRALCTEPNTLRVFGERSGLTQRFLARLDVPSQQAEGIFRDRLLRSLWAAIWSRDLRHLRETEFRCIVHVQGLHNLPENWQCTGIIFAHWHAPLTEAFWTWVKFAGVERGTIVGKDRWKLPQNDQAAVTLQSALDLRLAIRAIAAGRHAHILPDALGGRRPHYRAFWGRCRPFQPGFAELALRTRAPCHPVCVQLDDDGDIVIRIARAFARPEGDLSAEAAVQHLIVQYADHLAELWRERPAEIDSVQIRGFMLMPPVNRAEQASASNPKMAFCVGMLSSGSTWVFNAVRQIWLDEAPAGQLKSLYTEKGTDIDPEDHRYFVVKTHLNGGDHWYGMQNMMTVSQAPIILSVRDPLDAVASLMLRFGFDFEVALRQVVSSASAILSLMGRRTDALILRYEDGVIGKPETLDRIANHVGASPSAELRLQILENLSAEGVQSTIVQLAAEGVINAKRPWDPETNWHAGHIGDGRIGKYGEVLSEDRQRLVAEQTAAFARRFGYLPPVTKPRLAVLTDFEFWRADSFFAAWVAQCLEMIGRILRISIICIGKEPPDDTTRLPALEVVHLAPNATEVASVLAGEPILRTAIACTAPSNAALFRQAVGGIPGCRGAPSLEFIAEYGTPAHLSVTYPEGSCVRHPMAQLYDLSPQIGRVVDRSRALTVAEGGTHGWDEVVRACLERAAKARGIEADHIQCAPSAEHDPAFRERIAATRSPVVFIGSAVPAFEFCQAHLGSLDIPFLSASETCMFPLVRCRMGLPSLQRTIADFLDGAAPAPSPPHGVKRWQALLDSLVPQ